MKKLTAYLLAAAVFAAMTAAMSTPHEIDHTLLFDSASITE